MTEQMLVRMAMVLQNQAVSTMDRSLSKLVEVVLLENPSGVKVSTLTEMLDEQFLLSFTQNEVKRALQRKSKGRVRRVGDLYFLDEKAKGDLLSKVTMGGQLKGFIKDFVKIHSTNLECEEISQLLLKYLYFCFNSSVGNILSLLEPTKTKCNLDTFQASNEEIEIINAFLIWENAAKNQFVYEFTSVCYDYCMLTIKKDEVLSANLFKGKRFYLDSNIIFQIAGINNKERQAVIDVFVQNCKKNKIELYMTTSTWDEIRRVVAAQIDYIKDVTSHNEPIDDKVLNKLNPMEECNDFYRIYYEWCQGGQNYVADYDSFESYLWDMINPVLESLKLKQSVSRGFGNDVREFKSIVDDLLQYKEGRRKSRRTVRASVKVDANNVLDIMEWRTSKEGSIWQTNDFIVSADHVLINWAEERFSGVPLVVLPSVWLSIILRFAGRTENDYQSFCLFLTQRHRLSGEKIVNAEILLKDINKKTTDLNIKERIIEEIARHKDEYSFENADEYSGSVTKAFDKILEERESDYHRSIEEQAALIHRENSVKQQSASVQHELETKKARELAAIETCKVIAHQKAADNVCIFRKIYRLKNWWNLIVGLVSVWLLWELWIHMNLADVFLSKVLLSIPSIQNENVIKTFLTVIVMGVNLIPQAIWGLIKDYGSETRELELYKKHLEKNKKATKIESNMLEDVFSNGVDTTSNV